VFNALTENPTYQNRVLFHAVSSYLYLSKGVDTGSFRQWIRIIKNLTLNSQIDDFNSYSHAINRINDLAENRNSLLKYFREKGNATGFSQEQVLEEQIKAQIIDQDDDFAGMLYQAEQHPYFCGQIRSALYYSKGSDAQYSKDAFAQYWKKISALFECAKPKHGHLLRQALLTFGDYTLPAGNGEYKTLCVDDPKEMATSMKRLFSNHGDIVKKLLDRLDSNPNIESQLENIIKNSTVSKSCWRYCFIEFPSLFSGDWMSGSYLRLREVNGELLIVPKISSRGINYGVFLSALYESLKQHGIESYLDGDYGTWAIRFLRVNDFNVKFKEGRFIFEDAGRAIVFETKTDAPVDEAVNYLLEGNIKNST
jgi:hypothetical protein